MTPPRRGELRIVNPNTDTRVTRWLADEARRVAGERFEIVAVNAESGIAAIETPEQLVAAARAVAAAIGAPPRPRFAIVAGFGDPGLAEARALRVAPVVGLGESGLLAAGRGGRRFAILTLGAAMRESIRARAQSLGLGEGLAEIRIFPWSIAEMVADRDARRDEIAAAARACADETGAEAILLGGAPFAGLAASIARATRRVVLDGVEASLARLVDAAGPGEN
jgi:Asp/Glu/hydantoin racemase